MTSAVTFRLDGQTRQRIMKIARRRGVSVSEAIRQAVEAWVERDQVSSSPYEAVVDLIGVVHGGNPRRSTRTGRQLRELLKRRRGKQ
jgi:predicted DNA-binding protein